MISNGRRMAATRQRFEVFRFPVMQSTFCFPNIAIITIPAASLINYFRANDRSSKEKCNEYHDKRHNTKKHTLPDDRRRCSVEERNKRKALPPYEPYIYIIACIKGPQIEAKRIKDERTICRDASKFKPLRHVKVQQDKPNIPPAKVPSVPNTVEEPKETTETIKKSTQAETAQPVSNHVPLTTQAIGTSEESTGIRNSEQWKMKITTTDRHIYPY